jgi:hypothetical protein
MMATHLAILMVKVTAFLNLAPRGRGKETTEPAGLSLLEIGVSKGLKGIDVTWRETLKLP